MARVLRFQIPSVRCIGCTAEADGQIGLIDPKAFGPDGRLAGTATVYVEPPPDWVKLEPRDDRTPGRQPRTFYICSGCYGRGYEWNALRAVALPEAVPNG